jgi:hypothetical protein
MYLCASSVRFVFRIFISGGVRKLVITLLRA